MSMINYASREINCKLVYYGPGLGGKTTNLEHVYKKVSPQTRGKMISLAALGGAGGSPASTWAAATHTSRAGMR